MYVIKLPNLAQKTQRFYAKLLQNACSKLHLWFGFKQNLNIEMQNLIENDFIF